MLREPDSSALNPDSQLQQCRGPTVDYDSAGIGTERSRHDPQERALAGTVVPDDTERLSFLDTKRHVVEGDHFLGLAGAQTGQ
jgi:hypothetical protein